MTYVKIEDGIFRNPKVVSVSSSAKLIYVASICYCGASLTDGFVPTNAARMLSADAGVTYSPRIIRELVDAGLWKEIQGGYEIHDYLNHNESAAKVQAKKEAARERMEQMRSGKRSGSSREVHANNQRTSSEVRSTTTTTDTTSSSSEEEDSPKPPTKRKGELSEVQQSRFDRWYQSYPRKVSKADAVKAWANINPPPTNDLTDQMIAKVEEWTGSQEWSDPQYIPHPATWLNKGRWSDGAPTPRSAPGGLTIYQGGRGEKVGRDGKTDSERGWREDPGPKGWSADEAMRMAMAMDQQERERNSA